MKNYDLIRNPHTKNISLLPRKRLSKAGIRAWLTCQDRSSLCKLVSPAALKPSIPETAITDVIVLDPQTQYQSMLGFGGTIMDSDVYNLLRLGPKTRKQAIDDLMKPKGLGFNLMRIPFGSTDWNRDWDFYTYCDRPAGQKDMKLEHFSIQKDIDRGAIQIIKEHLSANPDMRILASVWGLPAWMKTNDNIIDGFFDSKYTEVYAKYLVKCIKAYEEQGIPIHYITTQNEPATAGDRKTPATMWTWEQQRDITIALHKQLKANKLKTEIWLHDHNFDMALNYVRPMLEDKRVRQAITAVAWHDYKGRPEDMALLHSLYPELPAVLPERGRHSLEEFAGLIYIIRNGATGNINWTTVTDDHGGPHQYEGGSDKYGPFTGDPLNVGNIMVVTEKSPATYAKPVIYYYYKHLSAFLQRGTKRILSNCPHNWNMASVAFVQPNGDLVFVAVNAGDKDENFALQLNDAAMPMRMPAMSMLTVRLPKKLVVKK